MTSLRTTFFHALGVWYAAAQMTAVCRQLGPRDKRSVSLWRLLFPAPRFPIPLHTGLRRAARFGNGSALVALVSVGQRGAVGRLLSSTPELTSNALVQCEHRSRGETFAAGCHVPHAPHREVDESCAAVRSSVLAAVPARASLSAATRDALLSDRHHSQQRIVPEETHRKCQVPGIAEDGHASSAGCRIAESEDRRPAPQAGE
jgi:hypothetical protein